MNVQMCHTHLAKRPRQRKVSERERRGEMQGLSRLQLTIRPNTRCVPTAHNPYHRTASVRRWLENCLRRPKREAKVDLAASQQADLTALGLPWSLTISWGLMPEDYRLLTFSTAFKRLKISQRWLKGPFVCRNIKQETSVNSASNSNVR